MSNKLQIAVVLFSLFLGLLYTVEKPDDSTVIGDRPKYDVADLKTPKLSETGYALFMRLVDSWPLGKFILWKIKRDSDFGIVEKFGAKVPQLPLFVPVQAPSADDLRLAQTATELFDLEKFIADVPNRAKVGAKGFRFWSVEDLIQGYKTNKFTPIDVVKAFFEASQQSNQGPMAIHAVIRVDEASVLEQASQAWKRIQLSTTLSPLDGIPIIIKENVDIAGYKNSQGTNGRIIGTTPSTKDAPVVERMRKLGMIILGKSSILYRDRIPGNMKEYAVLPVGLNAHWGDARNPYNHSHETGGSSSGSAAAVASGLVPWALGTDGGGSIRIPASLCGLVGLKPTHGRIAGKFNSVAVAGPMTTTVKDNAILYLAMAGANDDDTYSINQPSPHIHDFDRIQNLTDIKIGIYKQYFNHAEPRIVKATQNAVDALIARGAKIVEIELDHLQILDRAHKVTIMSEFANSVQDQWQQSRDELSMDTWAPILLGRSFSAKEYIAAQKLRRYFLEQWNSVLSKVDVIVTPTTAIPSPMIEGRLVDTAIVSQLMRFITASNFIGLPSITVPIGYTEDAHLPLGIQLISGHWSEHVLLRLGNAVEDSMVTAGITPKKPSIFFDTLPKTSL